MSFSTWTRTLFQFAALILFVSLGVLIGRLLPPLTIWSEPVPAGVDWVLPSVLGGAAFILLSLIVYTDSRRVDAQIAARIRATFDQLFEGVVVLDGSRRIVLSNRPFGHLIGEESASLTGHLLGDLACWSEPKGESLDWLEEIYQGKTIHNRSLRLRNGTQDRHVLVSGNTIRDRKGRIVEVVVTLHDTTMLEAQHVRLQRLLRRLRASQRRLRRARAELERRVAERTSEFMEANQQLQAAVERSERIEQQLREAKESAEAASRAKSEFLANTSHEIRTPLGAIIGHAEMLLDPHLPREESRRVLETITRNAHHLLQIINDVLDLSKIEAGKLQLTTQPCSPWLIVQETLGLLRMHAQEKGVLLQAEIQGVIPRVISSDPTRLRQILVNFVGNAIKFTPVGKQITVRLSGQRSPPRLQFAVIDQGIGMTEEQMSRLFQPFEQGDRSTTRRYRGTGLGLSICKYLADAMGGEISVASRVDEGSTFTLELVHLPSELEWVADPTELVAEKVNAIQRTSLSAYPVTRGKELSGRVLLVEDNPDNQRLLVYHLRRMGLEVDVAGDGVAGVVQALESSPSLVLMDMQMPEMDGYAATQTLRQRGYSGPILALTANATVEDRERCLSIGCNDYLTKPVDLLRLQLSIRSHLERRETTTDPVIRSTYHQDPAFREILKEYVRGLPAQVEQLRKGSREERRKLAHRMKGAAGMYGYPQFGEQARLVETALEEQQDESLLEELFDEMEILVNQICRGL